MAERPQGLEALGQYADGLLGVCCLLDRLHAAGYAHDDLTLFNAMLFFAEGGVRPILIDLASS
jgi:tRNA A-37 threonylcarbamoyl transferase component Bud32